MNELTRRDFLRLIGLGGAGVLIRPRALQALDRLGRVSRAGPLTSDVIQCWDPDATTGNIINQPVVQVMMDESIKRLTGQSEVGEAWKAVFPGIAETSIVGIKVNCINSSLPTHPALVICITNGLAQMDFSGTPFPRNNIIIWDRTNSELTASGYTLYTGSDPESVRCFGTNQSGVGYDTSTVLNVYGVNQYPSKILSQMCDYLIDAAVLKTHSQGVITLNMKNHYGSVNNPSALQHTNGCSSAIPSLNQQIRDVIEPHDIQKLFIIDGLFGLYSGGPGGAPNFNPKVIIMSRDIVACDCQGQNVINQERQRRGLSALNAAQITNAAQPPYNLGTTDINLIEINDPTGIADARSGPRSAPLLAVTPNPLRDRAELSLALAEAGPVTVDLVDVAGRSETKVFSGRLPVGTSRLRFQAERHLHRGSYYFRVQSRTGSSVHKVSVL